MRASTNFTEKTSVIAAKKDVTPTAVENKNMNIITLTTENEYQKLLTEAADKIVVVEFHAPWCGPCKLVKPEVEKIAQNYGEKILIIQVDIDDFEEFAISMEVTTTPTFVILKNKHKLEQFFTSKSEIIWEKVARAFGELK